MATKVKQGIRVKGGLPHERDMTRIVVSWCMNHFNLDVDKTSINVLLWPVPDCNGTCVDNDEGGYDIEINFNQSLRDFIATIVHEMVHVKQYVTGKCKGGGEREANKLQYKLTDKIWKENIL
jgi:predicted metallopeptidase